MENELSSPNTKTICVNLETKEERSKRLRDEKKQLKMQKERHPRVVTQTKKWASNIGDDDYNITNQIELVNSMMEVRDIRDIRDIRNKTEKHQLLYSQINAKIQGYKSQDISKQKYAPELFIDYDFVINKLKDCSLTCFYCKEHLFVWYKNIREPKQWSIERINNDYGHNKNNVEIACLSCNLKRRCMYHERFRFTKQMRLSKVESETTD